MLSLHTEPNEQQDSDCTSPDSKSNLQQEPNQSAASPACPQSHEQPPLSLTEPHPTHPTHLFLLPTACLQLITQAAGAASRQVCKHFLNAYGPFQEGLRPFGLPTTSQLHTIFTHPLIFHRIHTLDLSPTYSRVRDPTLTLLAQACTSLQTLSLCGCFRVTDIGLQTLAPLAPTLKTLNLRGLSHNGSVSITSLQALVSLQSLTVPEYHDLSTKHHLSSLQHLSHLTLFEVVPAHHDSDALPSSSNICIHLSSLPNLQHLSLPHIHTVTTEALWQLSTHTLLTHVHINSAQRLRQPLPAFLLPVLVHLTALTTLALESPLHDPQAFTNSPLTNLLHLRSLTAAFNADATEELASLAALPFLTSLRLTTFQASEQLSSLSVLSQQLRELILEGHGYWNVTYLRHISSLSGLQTLHIRHLYPSYEADALEASNLGQAQLPGSFFPDLRSFSISGRWKDPGALASVASLSRLTRISIGARMHYHSSRSSSYLRTNFDREVNQPQEDLRMLTQLSDLAELSWAGLMADYDDDALKVLSELQQLDKLHRQQHVLRKLDLQQCTRLNGSCLKHLPTSLRWLSMSACARVEAGNMEYLSRLTQLEWLDLSHCPGVDDNSLMWMCRLSRLRFLDLTGCESVTGWGLSALSGLSELSELVMENCKGLNDDGIVAMGALPCGVQRFKFGCEGWRVSGETIAGLREVCPDVLM